MIADEHDVGRAEPGGWPSSMLRHGVDVQAEVTVTLHRVDEDFFDVF